MSYGDIGPKDVYRETGRWAPVAVVVGIVAVVVVALIVVVGWQIGWWFSAQNATRQAEITQNGYSNQTTLRQQVTAKLADVTSITTQLAEPDITPDQAAALKAQRAAIAAIACSDAAQITGPPLPAGQAQWVAANCSDGSVSPSSTLYVTGAP